MDSINFLKSISYQNFIQAIIEHFDENMALYNILKDSSSSDSDMHVTGYPNDRFCISFNIVFKTENKAQSMMIDLRGRKPIITMYNNTFSIEVHPNEIDSCALIVIMRRVS